MSTMPTIYLPHGGGPWPWTQAFTPALAADYEPLRAYLESIPRALPRRPVGIVIVSAHWEAPTPTVIASKRPGLFYDYYGFPKDTYQLHWDAPGSPQLAARVRHLLGVAAIESAEDVGRGFDHGTFVPLKLAFPDADVPVVQLSLDASYDPARHVAIGRALTTLRKEGVLIVGSGMSWEDFRSKDIVRRSEAFDEWFRHAATAQPTIRDDLLVRWTEAPHARDAHPHEEHLLPMMVAAGAAGPDRGQIAWTGSLMGIRISAVHFSGS